MNSATCKWHQISPSRSHIDNWPSRAKPSRLILSPRFTFLVGQEKKAIVVHAAAIAAVSQQLDALINNGIKESEERCGKLENVQVDDFIRFCEYAYRGDYTTPLWQFAATSEGYKKKKLKYNRRKSSDSPVAESTPVPAPEPPVEVYQFHEAVAESEPAPPLEAPVLPHKFLQTLSGMPKGTIPQHGRGRQWKRLSVDL